MSYHLRTFGGLDIRGEDGEQIESLLAHSKGAALLAYLAVEVREEGLDRSEAAALLWHDREESRARNALSITLSRLRQATDPPLVRGKGEPVLRIATGALEVDAWAFRAALDRGDAARASSLYRGHFLAGFRVADAPRFERWADDRRERFRDQAHQAALTAGRAAREAGSLEEATATLERALELRPLREAPALELVRTLAERGRTAEALQRFEAFRERREEELDLAPSGEFEALIERIRDGEVERQAPKPDGGRKQADSSTPEEAAPAGSGKEAVENRPAAGHGGREAGAPFWRRPAGWSLAALALVAATLGLWQLFGSGEGAPSPPPDRSVAVLPFEAVGTEDPGAIAEGLHNDLLTRLSNVSGLKVISARSVEQFRESDLPLASIADSLGVRWIVEGGVQRAGGAFQVNVQLVDPRTETHAWAESYRRELTAGDLFALQGKIARRVADELEARLGSGEEGRLDRQGTESLAAYRSYVRGRSLLEQVAFPELRRSIRHFDQAIAEDSSFAAAWAGRSEALSVLATGVGEGRDTLFTQAEEAAKQALELDPESAEAYAARGRLRYHRRHGPEALRDLRRAVALRPGYATAHAWLAHLLLHLGRPQEALVHAGRARDLSPLSLPTSRAFALTHLANGKFDSALEEARRTVELWYSPDKPRELMASALFHARDLVRLREMADQGGAAGIASRFIAVVEASSGDTTAAADLVRGVDPTEEPVAAVLLHAALGHDDRALGILSDVYPRWEGLLDVPFEVSLRYFYPETLAGIRADPRYEEFLREVYRSWGLNPDGSLPDSVNVSFGSPDDADG